MNTPAVFYPPLKNGLILHLVALVAVIALGIYGLWQASLAELGLTFFFYLLLPLLAFGLGPAIAYRAYALYKASYQVSNDGLQMRWGLRVEDVPMDRVLWVKTEAELPAALALPARIPGAVLGEKVIPGLGAVEFLAASAENLVLVATPERIFALTPEDPQAFLHAMRRSMEYVSLSPLEARSVYPTFVAGNVWSARPARLLMIASVALSLLLLIGVSLWVPGRGQIAWDFDPSGLPGELAPAVRLMLLPVLNLFFVLIDLMLGVFFYRRVELRLLSYLLFGGGVLTPVLIFSAVFFILSASQGF